MEYIHYGANKFDKEKFVEIKNRDLFTKPYGGFWASRVDAMYEWKEWTADNNYCEDRYREDNCFKFKLKEGTRLLVINSARQLSNLPKITDKYINTFICLNFEELTKEYDAIEVLISEDRKLYWDLYGWDCDSILIMNKDIVEVI